MIDFFRRITPLRKPNHLTIVVGLGNPGIEYKYTRHNVGLWCLDRIQATYSIAINKKKQHFESGQGNIRNKEIILARSRTFMNESGRVIKSLSTMYKVSPANFLVLSGDDGLTSKMIAMGGDGVIAVIGQSHPKDFSAMVRAGLKGDIEKANQLHEKLSPIYEPLYIDGNPAGIKATLNIMGICKNILRPPLVGVTDETYNNLKRFIGH